VVITTPVPRPTHRFWRCVNRCITISRYAGSCAGAPAFFSSYGARLATSFRSTRLPTVSPANPRSELGPRSLDPAALFGARLPSLFETSRRLPTSATALRRAGNQTMIRLLILAGTETSISFLFFCTSRPSPCEDGDVWRAALRPSNRPQCWFLSVTRVCPTVMPIRPPHHL